MASSQVQVCTSWSPLASSLDPSGATATTSVQNDIRFLMTDHFFILALTVLGIVSLMFNFMLIFLIFSKNSADLKGYRWCILHLTVSNVIFTLVLCFLYQPRPLIPLFGGIVLGPIKSLGMIWGGYAPFVLIFSLVCYNLQTVTVCFVYRYVEFVRYEFYERINSARMNIIICVYLLTTLGLQLWLFSKAIPTAKDSCHDIDPTQLPFSITDLQEFYFFFVFNLEKYRWTVLVFIEIGIGACYLNAVNLLCSWCVVRAIYIRKRSMSSSQRQLQIRMIKALGLQALSPLLFIFGPGAILIFCLYSKKMVEPINELYVLLTVGHAILTPVVNIYFIDAYRLSVSKRLSRYAMRRRRTIAVRPHGDESAVNPNSGTQISTVDMVTRMGANQTTSETAELRQLDTATRSAIRDKT